MANRKISDLTALTAPASGDLLPIVDISEAAAADKNKKITIQSLFQGIPVNVGIGTSAPSNTIDVNGTGRFRLGGTNQLVFTTDGGNPYILSEQNAPLHFGTNNLLRATIDSSGNVGIGTTVLPGNKVTVGTGNATADSSIVKFNTANANVTALTLSNWDGTSTIYGPRISFDNSGRGAFVIGGSDAANNFDICRIWGTPDLRIDSSGRLLVGTADSGGALLQVNGDRIRIGTAKTPASATATGTTGEIAWDANYIYVCTATNTWKRTAIATW